MRVRQPQDAKVASDVGRADFVAVHAAFAKQIGQTRLGDTHVASLGRNQQLFPFHSGSLGATLASGYDRGGRLIQPPRAALDTSGEQPYFGIAGRELEGEPQPVSRLGEVTRVVRLPRLPHRPVRCQGTPREEEQRGENDHCRDQPG